MTKYDDPFEPNKIVSYSSDTTIEFDPATLTFSCYNNKGWIVVPYSDVYSNGTGIKQYLNTLPDWSVNPVGKNDFNIKHILTDDEKKMLNDTFTPGKKKDKKKDNNKAYERAMKGI